VLRGPWLCEGKLEVVWHGDANGFEGLAGSWEGGWVKTFPLPVHLWPVVLARPGHEVVRVRQRVSHLFELS